jgi:hypothetical protein
MPASGMLRLVALVRTDVSEERDESATEARCEEMLRVMGTFSMDCQRGEGGGGGGRGSGMGLLNDHTTKPNSVALVEGRIVYSKQKG